METNIHGHVWQQNLKLGAISTSRTLAQVGQNNIYGGALSCSLRVDRIAILWNLQRLESRNSNSKTRNTERTATPEKHESFIKFTSKHTTSTINVPLYHYPSNFKQQCMHKVVSCTSFGCKIPCKCVRPLRASKGRCLPNHTCIHVINVYYY